MSLILDSPVASRASCSIGAPRDAAPPAPVATMPVTRVFNRDENAVAATVDQIIEEIPVALTYNGISHAVLLATPDHLEDLALGFSLSEGILSGAEELFDIETVSAEKGIALELTVSGRAFMELKNRRRQLAGRTGCGLCGIESLDQVVLNFQPLNRKPNFIPAKMIFDAVMKIPALQMLRLQTGATHSAAWVGLDGRVRALREDVGRHNALDKCFGAMTKAHEDFRKGFVFVSSRASFEMVQKTAMLGVDTLVAASAPTAMAIRLAKKAGIRLIGFAREKQAVVYS
jgi:formate dehydrogenase accessory protein FdhD